MDLSNTDWRILELCDSDRQTRANLAAAADVTPNYVSREVSALADLGLVEQAGIADNSGMWVTTEKGSFVIDKQEKYDKQHSELFGVLVNDVMDLTEELVDETGLQVDPGDIMHTTMESVTGLQDIEDLSRITPTAASDAFGKDMFATHGLLYELYFHDLLARSDTSEAVVYDFTPRGRSLLDHPVQDSVVAQHKRWLTTRA